MIRIVVSAVNLTEGGPLTVLRECLAAAVAVLPEDWEIIALVNRADLIREPRVRIITIASAKKSWFFRLYWEWFGFMRMSREIKPALWFSLHDITSRVSTTRQAVYCHNASSFYHLTFRDALFDPKFFIFNQLYILLYSIFIKRNYYVVVQQKWIREEFFRRIGQLPVIVAHPCLHLSTIDNTHTTSTNFVFLYPSLPRVFKNIELLCKAVQILMSRGVTGFEVRLTIDGTENRYARWLLRQFGKTEQIKFLGRQTKDEMIMQYRESSSVVFPSKLETWGLPITEAKSYRRPLLVADLPYARETVGTYDLVSFFSAESVEELANLMQSMIQYTWKPMGNDKAYPEAPFAPDWSSLWDILTKGLSPVLHKNENVSNINKYAI